MVVRLIHRICSCLGKNLQAWFSDHTKSSKTLTAWNLSSLWWLFQAYSLALLTLLPNTLIHHLSSMFNFLFWFNKFFLLFFFFCTKVWLHLCWSFFPKCHIFFWTELKLFENIYGFWLAFSFLLLLKASSTDFDKWYYRLPTPTQVLQTQNKTLMS